MYVYNANTHTHKNSKINQRDNIYTNMWGFFIHWLGSARLGTTAKRGRDLHFHHDGVNCLNRKCLTFRGAELIEAASSKSDSKTADKRLLDS